MKEGLEVWVEILFIIAFISTLVVYYYANQKPLKLMLVIVLWSIVQLVLAHQGFYQNTDSTPPRFIFILAPSVIAIIIALRSPRLNEQLQQRNLKISTFLHTVRIPVEIVLHQLFLHSMIPQLMTYEGRNFDILIGITAPIVGILYYKKMIGDKALLIWNIIGLFFVLFILINALLSAETPLQQFAFDQPNRAIIYAPFVLLASTIVPLVVYSHILDIIKLRRMRG